MKTTGAVSVVVLGAVLVGSVCGCSRSPSDRGSPSYQLGIIKYQLNSLRGDFKQGVAIRPPRKPGDRPDGRMTIMFMLMKKLKSNIPNRVAEQRKKDRALAKLAEAEEYFTKQIAPKHQIAVKSKKPEDAKALVPLMDQLDKYMDELLKILG